MLVAASSPLTKVVPGLMIWTVIFFFVVFFILRKFAFGPLQNMLDQRRDSIRQSVEAADHARAEAERLLEEHRKLIAEARGQGRAHRGAHAAALPPLGADIAVAHRIYAEALFGAAKDASRLAPVHEALGDFGAAIAESPELRAVLRNPQLEPSAKAAILADLAGEEEPLFAHFLQVVAEKGRAGELEEIAKEFQRLMAREERRLTVELTTARELSDAEAKAILKQIEDAAGRKVEATQKVDPDLVGGIVLQAGSLRVDASVRGRLERLRNELVRS